MKSLRCLAALVLLAAMNARAQSEPALPDNGIARIVAMRQQSLVDTHDFIDRRAAFEKLMAGLPAPDGVTIHTVSANGVAAKWIAPNSGNAHHRSVILYLHGGGFYSGSSDSHRMLAATLAKDAQADVLLIDYRRLLEQGYPASNIALAGESAGGNLVLELALRLRDAHRPLPSSMVAMSPIMDLTASGDSTLANANRDPVLQRAGLLDVTRAYMKGADPRSPGASPLFADLHGLPPLLLQVASGEILLDDSLRIARVAALDDVSVSVEVWPGMVHQWQLFPTLVPDARRALKDSGAFIQAHMAHTGAAS